ncbi:MAG TPA: hypothetical protein VFY99_03285 [Solirubrobacterales bacterium]
MSGAAFYCMSSEVYFLGAIGLINSLRLVGHEEPIYLLDCGLAPAHRERLEAHVTVLDAPPDVPPYLLKTLAPRAHPAEVMVLIDVDMVATRSLAPLIERAARGGVVAVKDRMDRFVPEWGSALDLGPVRRAPYVSSGLVALGGKEGAEVLALVDDRLPRADYERSWFGRDEPGYPLAYLDQDVLNAVIAARLEPGRVEVLDPRLAPVPPLNELRVLDPATLRCAYDDGVEPYVLHHFVVKPWLEPLYHGPYSQLLRRLWLGDDVAIPIAEEELPRRLRRGWPARIERRAVDVWDLGRWYARRIRRRA